MPSQFTFPPWNAAVNYSKFDIAQAASAGPFHYSLQDNNLGNNPSGLFIYGLTNYTRENNIVTVNFTKTGSGPNFTAGSLISMTGGFQDLTYTGMVIEGGAGYVKYLNVGWPVNSPVSFTGQFIRSVMSPAWTSGFFFNPTYSSKINVENKTVVASFGDLYQQRMSAGLNTATKAWTMVFQSRSDKEMQAIVNYIEDAAGVRAFPILIPVSALENQPNQKYTSVTVDYAPESFGLNTINVAINRVYDI